MKEKEAKVQSLILTPYNKQIQEETGQKKLQVTPTASHDTSIYTILTEIMIFTLCGRIQTIKSKDKLNKSSPLCSHTTHSKQILLGSGTLLTDDPQV